MSSKKQSKKKNSYLLTKAWRRLQFFRVSSNFTWFLQKDRCMKAVTPIWAPILTLTRIQIYSERSVFLRR